MKRYLMFLVILLMVGCDLFTTIKSGSEFYVCTAKLVGVDYHAFGGWHTVRYWILKFDNDMVIQVERRKHIKMPDMYHIGMIYDIYQYKTNLRADKNKILYYVKIKKEK